MVLQVMAFPVPLSNGVANFAACTFFQLGLGYKYVENGYYSGYES
jgi:hypothetical protein